MYRSAGEVGAFRRQYKCRLTAAKPYNRASPDGNAPLFPLRGTSPGGGSLLYAFLRSYVAHCIVSIVPPQAGALWVLSFVPHNSTRKRRADLPLRGRCRRQKGCISTSVARFACFPLWRPCRGSPSRAKLVLSLHIKGPPYELPDRCQRRGCLV